MYTYAAGSPGTFHGLGRTIAVRIYDTEEERQAALAAHAKRLEEQAAAGLDPQDQPTEKEKYEALDWNKLTLKEPPKPPRFLLGWGTLAGLGLAAVVGLVALRAVRKKR